MTGNTTAFDLRSLTKPEALNQQIKTSDSIDMARRGAFTRRANFSTMTRSTTDFDLRTLTEPRALNQPLTLHVLSIQRVEACLRDECIFIM
jgi:hypothetical protein